MFLLKKILCNNIFSEFNNQSKVIVAIVLLVCLLYKKQDFSLKKVTQCVSEIYRDFYYR